MVRLVRIQLRKREDSGALEPVYRDARRGVHRLIGLRGRSHDRPD